MVVSLGALTVKFTSQSQGQAGSSSTDSSASSLRWISMYWSAVENTA